MPRPDRPSIAPLCYSSLTVPKSARPTTRQVRLRPQNPFDLIRLLARSQSDPRKAVAELVQNSLDAGAQRIEIEWFNEQGARALRIWDDGEGVFPELEREDALRRIAKTIGHSHKLDLSPSQRRDQMVLGKYGIGLIGFWSAGGVLEMKSRVEGSKVFVLRLREDRATAEVFPSRSRKLAEEATFTEVTIKHVHVGAFSKIRPPRLQAFLANELRGQLLERGAVVRIRDRVARGRARKEFIVEPRPYLGAPLEEWRELDVPGFETARVELYLVPLEEERDGVVALACGGTVVLDDIAEIDGIDVPRAPWCEGRLEGVIDFPELHVAPGSRRGFAHDEPVAAFLAALERLERELVERVAEERARRAERKRENVTREIRRAFRSVAERLPEYDFFAVQPKATAPEGRDAGAAEGTAEGAGAGAGDDDDVEATRGTPGEVIPAEHTDDPASTPFPPRASEPDEHLFPPGPLAQLELAPKRLRVPLGASRGVRARALDADGRPVRDDVVVTWRLEGPGELTPDGPRAVYRAPDVLEGSVDAEPPTIRIHVRATQAEHTTLATIEVKLTGGPGRSGAVPGIPDPHPVRAPGEPWRSRWRDDRWEVNEAHRDYLVVADVEAHRVQYLIHLFAKEIVLRNFGRPGDDENLERMVEVLTHLDRKGGRRPG